MKLSVKSDYAARAILELARHYPDGGARRVEELADLQGAPSSYLSQILLELKRQHLVTSQRGQQGGYLLARPPAEISLGDVLRCVHGQIFETPGKKDAQGPVELRNAWQKLERQVEAFADSITFQDLLEADDTHAKMYYI